MSSTCDIRHIQDPNENPNVISRLLKTHPPSGVPLLDSAGRPLPEGLDCLTHLIRHLRAQWLDYSENAEDKEEEAINPILRYAWLKFYPDSEDPEQDLELVGEARKAKGDVSRALQLVHVDLEHMGEFLELCCSPLMNQTLWSRREWYLLYSILYRDANEPIWREKACPGREENGRRSLLHYDCRIEKSLSLQDFISTQFEPRINADGSSELWLSQAPKVVRVLYNPSTIARQSFHDLRDFEMPIFNNTRAAEWLNDVGTFDDMPRKTLAYTLLAVVRCGDTQTGVDVIRTYEPYTSPMPTSYLRSFFGSQHDWSLQDDTPAQYLLVYGNFAQGRIYDAVCDESWPLLPEDEEVEEIMDWAFDALLEELSKPQPQPQAPGTRL
ncbi:hypothetical protein C2857_007417 [Epichloe festucae Fl1]|uniref:Uncharacterized protein n=1 Tax=Epichloe festucae (strain Fl1) TaxID=877507 RepID=A0A7S9PUR1_EPIFF|nr:hypothetical protein C2857_007417 [Epichloe festucae Fl1]